MRLVAGGGAVTELLLAGRCGEGAERPGALWQRSIGKKLLAGRREGRKWSLPQPVARILLCGALPELKVKNLLLQCTYNGACRDFLPHFNRNPA